MNQAQRFFVGLFSALLGTLSFICFISYPFARGAREIGWREIIESAWFTIQTITTTGYGSIPWPWGAKLQLISTVTMIGAIPIWTLLLGLAVNLVDQRLKKLKGNSRGH